MYVYIYNFTAEIAAYTCFRVCASVLFLGTNGSHDRKNTKYVLPAEEPRGLWSSAGPVGGREGVALTAMGHRRCRHGAWGLCLSSIVYTAYNI